MPPAASTGAVLLGLAWRGLEARSRGTAVLPGRLRGELSGSGWAARRWVRPALHPEGARRAPGVRGSPVPLLGAVSTRVPEGARRRPRVPHLTAWRVDRLARTDQRRVRPASENPLSPRCGGPRTR